MRHAVATLLGVAALLLATPSSADEAALTLARALELGRARAAQVLAASGRVEEARARLGPASLRFRENPAVDLGGGRRRAERASFTDLDISLSQGLEPAARRRARVAGAEAGLEVAESEWEDARRLYLGEVAGAFFRALAAAERLRLATAAAGLAEDLLATTERRSAMGEGTALELNRVRIAAAAARAARLSAEGERLRAAGELRALLGLAPDAAVNVAGSLRDLPAYELAPLLARAGERPDLQAFAAAAREAQTQVRLGEAARRPDFALRTGYARDAGDDVVTAGVAVALPWFQRGQEETGVGRARLASFAARQEAARRTAEAEVRAAFDDYQHRAQAVAELERTALPALEDNQTLARRSFEVGEINLGELLLLRRESLEIRLSHLDLLLAAHLAAVELETRAGAQR